MRIESFWARGFRSLRDVRIDDLGAFNVFYGRNGSGKSNLLAAIEAWLQLIPIALQTVVPLDVMRGRLPDLRALERMRGHRAYHAPGALLRAHDFTLHSPQHTLILGGTLLDLGEHRCAGDREGSDVPREVPLPSAERTRLFACVWTCLHLPPHSPTRLSVYPFPGCFPQTRR